MAIFNKGDANTAQTTIISSGTLIKGELHLSCILHIDGNVEGDVISDNTVVIGKNGTARGSIRVCRPRWRPPGQAAASKWAQNLMEKAL